MSLFLIALLPPDEINQQVLVWKEYMFNRFQCKVALKSPAHITLIPPFRHPDEQLPALTGTLERFSLTHKAFQVELCNFAAFAPRVIYVGVKHNTIVEQLKKELETLLLSESFGIKKEERPFHPHVTIANRDLKKQDFSPAWGYFRNLSYETRFTATSVTLLKHNGNSWQRLFDAAFS